MEHSASSGLFVFFTAKAWQFGVENYSFAECQAEPGIEDYAVAANFQFAEKLGKLKTCRHIDIAFQQGVYGNSTSAGCKTNSS
jgi:hypothetical protein